MHFRGSFGFLEQEPSRHANITLVLFRSLFLFPWHSSCFSVGYYFRVTICSHGRVYVCVGEPACRGTGAGTHLS